MLTFMGQVMKIAFIYGAPASGKLTIARELARLSGWALFHNHLIVDAIASVFEFGAPNFVELREKFWLDVFQAAKDSDKDLIFTFAPEPSVRPDFMANYLSEFGAQTYFVKLNTSVETLLARVANSDRREFGKLTDKDLFTQLSGAFLNSLAQMPSPHLVIDTENTNPIAAATEIWRKIQGEVL